MSSALRLAALAAAIFATAARPCPPRLTATWAQFQYECYYAGRNLRRNFISAQAYCEGMDSTLPSVPNARVNAFLNDLMQRKPFWIGLKRQAGSTRFIRVRSRSTATYTNWKQGKPSTGTNERGVNMNGEGLWADKNPRGEALPLVCQLK